MGGDNEHPGKESDPPHDDREHEKADQKGPDHEHWEKAHGSGVPGQK